MCYCRYFIHSFAIFFFHFTFFSWILFSLPLFFLSVVFLLSICITFLPHHQSSLGLMLLFFYTQLYSHSISSTNTHTHTHTRTYFLWTRRVLFWKFFFRVEDELVRKTTKTTAVWYTMEGNTIISHGICMKNDFVHMRRSDKTLDCAMHRPMFRLTQQHTSQLAVLVPSLFINDENKFSAFQFFSLRFFFLL